MQFPRDMYFTCIIGTENDITKFIEICSPKDLRALILAFIQRTQNKLFA